MSVPGAPDGTGIARSGNGGVTTLREYYETVAPFYAAEMECRDDVAAWVALAGRVGARTVLDLGCGGGRVTRALGAAHRAVGVDLLAALLPPDRAGRDFLFVRGDLRRLPFADASFDLAIAANDPFAHLLEDVDRARALDEATRVAGLVVVDGLRLSADDDAQARSGGLVRERALPGEVLRCERWTALGGGRYRTRYRYVRDGETLAEASADVRAWDPDEPALARAGVRIRGGLDGGPFHPLDPGQDGFVIEIGEPR